MGRRKGSGFRVGGAGALFLLVCVTTGLGSLDAAVGGEDSLEVRRARVESMDAATKAQLLRRLESFRMMSPNQQERLRQVHEQLDRDPQAAKLRDVMQRYYEWLKTLKPYQKAELAELAPRERVERIKRIRQEQARRDVKRSSSDDVARADRLKRLLQEQIPKAGKRLNQEDVEGLLRWTEQYLDASAAKLIDASPARQRQEHQGQLARVKDPDRRREILAAIWLRGQVANPGKLPALTKAELTDLRHRLSPATRQRLEALPEPEQQRHVAFWLRLMLLNYTASHHLPRLPGAVSDEELGEFLEHRLNPAARDWLLSLPPEEMQRELWAQYLRSRMLEPAATNRAAGAKPGGGAKPQRPGGKKAGAALPSALHPTPEVNSPNARPAKPKAERAKDGVPKP